MIRLLLPLVLIALESGPGRAAAPGMRGAGRIFIDAVAADKNGLPVDGSQAGRGRGLDRHFRVPIESFTVVTPSADPSAGRLTVLMLDDVTLPLQQLAGPRTSRGGSSTR